MRCPRDDHEMSGRPLTCDECQGCWVSVADLSKTVKSNVQRWVVENTSQLACPECYAPMEGLRVQDVHLDRCVEHGVWFDVGEITDMLRRTGKLGDGEIARADTQSTASRIGEGAAGVGKAILEVLVAAVDIVT